MVWVDGAGRGLWEITFQRVCLFYSVRLSAIIMAKVQ